MFSPCPQSKHSIYLTGAFNDKELRGILLSKKELWSHAEHFEWSLDALYGHIHRLFDSVVSTKEPLEDMIGVLTDSVKRGQRNPFKAMAPERALFDQARKIRWDSTSWPLAEVLPADFEERDMLSLERNRARLFSTHPKVFKSDSKTILASMEQLGIKPRGGILGYGMRECCCRIFCRVSMCRVVLGGIWRYVALFLMLSVGHAFSRPWMIQCCFSPCLQDYLVHLQTWKSPSTRRTP